MPHHIMKTPVRTEGLIMITTGYEPAVRDATGELAMGHHVYRAYVTTVTLPGEVRRRSWAAKVLGEPNGLEVGQAMVAREQVATDSEIDGCRRIGFRAATVISGDSSARWSGSGRQAA